MNHIEKIEKLIREMIIGYSKENNLLVMLDSNYDKETILVKVLNKEVNKNG
jgi:hypothetical protein